MKKFILMVCMCISVLNLNAQSRFYINLTPYVSCNDNAGHYYDRHRVPRKSVKAFCEDGMLYLQNAPVGGRIAFYDGLGELIKEEIIQMSNFCILLPVSTVTMEVSDSNVVFVGVLK